MAPAATSTGTATAGELTRPNPWRVKLWELLFLTDKTHRYYLARESFLLQFENTALVLITLFSLLSAFNIQNVPSSLIVFLLTTTLLIFQPARASARNHVMRVRFAALLGDVEAAYDSGTDDKETYLRLAGAARNLAVKETGEYFRVLEATCHNDVVRMRRCQPSTAIPIPPWKARLMYVWPFRNFGLD